MPTYENLLTGEVRQLTAEEADRFFDNRPPDDWQRRFECPECNGTCQLEVPMHGALDTPEADFTWIDCPECAGRGWVVEE